MVEGRGIQEIKPPISLSSFFDGRPSKLWCSGEQAILNRRLLGVISARQIDADLALKSSAILKQLSTLNEVAFIGGWHSPLEEEALHILSSQRASIVFCVSKSLHRFVPSAALESQVSRGEALLLTHCSPKAKRISRDASIRRNQLVTCLATALLVLSAPAGSSSLNLAKATLRQGKPVFTPEHRMNKELLANSALSATFDNIRAALG
jgi:predicted Rossmann fold nucleotide-binding protein DprA/Smf involved in DNA uptake